MGRSTTRKMRYVLWCRLGQAQEEMHQWSHDMDQQQWEEDERMWLDHIAPEIYNPQELK